MDSVKHFNVYIMVPLSILAFCCPLELQRRENWKRDLRKHKTEPVEFFCPIISNKYKFAVKIYPRLSELRPPLLEVLCKKFLLGQQEHLPACIFVRYLLC